MRTVTLGLASPQDAKNRLRAALKGEAQGEFISFTSVELIWKVLTATRWQLLKMMRGAGPMPIREAARRIERDVKAVHADIQALLEVGTLLKTEDGLIEFPYDRIKVDFMLAAA